MLIMVIILFAARVHALTGQDVLDDCAVALAGSEDLTVEQLLNGTHCMGYVAGMNDMAPLLPALSRTAAWCPPGGALAPGEAVRAFIKWLAAHPARLEQSARSLFISAMSDSFPCH
jgi:hypothetical protein